MLNTNISLCIIGFITCIALLFFIAGCSKPEPIEMVKWTECERMLIIHGHGC